MANPSINSMFDKEVIDEMRRQFDAADVNGDGELDAGEACLVVARTCSPDASPEAIQRLADGLRNQVDADRSGTVSFEEYCFRFGRRYQIEVNKRRRAGGGSVASTTNASNAAIKEKDSNNFGGRGPPLGAASGTAAAATNSTRGLQPEGSADSNDVSAAAGTSATETDPAEELRREREALRREREELQRQREELTRQRKIEEFAARSAASDGPAAASGTTAGSGSSAQAAPPRIAPGARVTLHGLRAIPELNGSTGRVARFDGASGRFVVELDGGGGEKSIRADNLTLCSSAGYSASSPSGMTMGARLSKSAKHMQDWCMKAATRVQAWCMNAAAHVQVWLAGYEIWQILLGLGLIVLFVAAWFQVSARYPGPGGKTQASMGRPSSRASSYDSSTYSGSEYSSSHTDSHGYGSSHGSEYSDGAYTDGDFHRDTEHRHSERPPRRQPQHSPRYDEDVDDDYGYGGSSYGYGSGGCLLGSLGQTHGMLVLVVIGVLCWKGIIPVHRMSFFQMYMLWQMLEPLLFGGGRRRSYGYGGYGGSMFGRGRRFF